MPTEAPEPPNTSDVFRLEVLRPILLDPIKWHVSEAVVCRRGASRSILRLIKRYHRVADLLVQRCRIEQDLATRKPPMVQRESASVFPTSPYATTVGIRLTLNGKMLEQCMPWGQPVLSSNVEPPAAQQSPTARRATSASVKK